MVKRYHSLDRMIPASYKGEVIGDYVLYSDYLALQKALGEALDRWAEFDNLNELGSSDYKRISLLRSQYLKG